MFHGLIVVDLTTVRHDYTVRAQTFSPGNNGGGAWGPVVEAPAPEDIDLRNEVLARASPVIVGGVLHWLSTDHCTILTFNSDTSEASIGCCATSARRSSSSSRRRRTGS